MHGIIDRPDFGKCLLHCLQLSIEELVSIHRNGKKDYWIDVNSNTKTMFEMYLINDCLTNTHSLSLN